MCVCCLFGWLVGLGVVVVFVVFYCFFKKRKKYIIIIIIFIKSTGAGMCLFIYLF